MNFLNRNRGSLAKWTGAALGAAPVFVWGLAPVAAAESVAKRPNIILVLADDMGYGDLNCYGGKGARTANIDRLAAEGVRFTQFYVNSPICSPSRTALTTGQYPARWRITSFINNRAANEARGMAQWLDVKAPTLARSLSGAGYLTGHFGKWHMGGGRDVGEAPLPAEYGYSASLTQFEGLGDRILPINDGQKVGLGIASEKLGRGKVQWVPRSQVTKSFVDRSLEFVKGAEQSGKPFYINVWPDDVHSPFDPPASLRGDGSKRALYHGVLTNMDAQLGPLFDYVRNSPKLRDNTLIVFASDNGPEPGAGTSGGLRGNKGNLYEGGIREPFIVWAPGLLAKNSRGTVNKSAVFSSVDFLPSVLSLAGVKTVPAGDGEDVSAAWLGKASTGRSKPLFWRRPPDREGTNERELPDLAVREGDWKLLTQVDGSKTQLYNLAKDVNETTDVASEQPQVVQHLKEAVLAWNRTLPADGVIPPTAKSQFDLKNGQHLGRRQSPAIAQRGFTITAEFDAKAPNGVIVAHGGVAQGYVLYLDEQGKLVFLVRVKGEATSVASPSTLLGAHKVTAQLGADRRLSLSVDGQVVATGQAPSLLASLPVDGLDVGSDTGGPVGPYQSESPFQGRIDGVRIELAG